MAAGGDVPPTEVGTARRRVPTPGDLALVAAGGAIGAVLRVAFVEAFPAGDDRFPWTTFAENVSGAFLLGLILTLVAGRWAGNRVARLLLCTGLLGAFTTYSGFATELAARSDAGRLVLAMGYLVASLVCGLVAALAGVRLARLLSGAARRGDQRGPG